MKYIKYIVVAALFGVIATAATKGDQAPALTVGVVMCPGDGGYAEIPMMPNQNAIGLRNFLTDGGTSQTIYVSTDGGMNNRTGFPIQAGETLSIDIVALTQTATMAVAVDGGSSLTSASMRVGTLQPKLFCSTTLNNLQGQELHYIMVK